MNLKRLLLSSAILLSSAVAIASDVWPSKELHLIVPFGPGSNPDQISRMVASEASKSLGQTIVVENKPGAGGNIGTAAIANAKPDGYTFGMSINGPLVYNQYIYDNLKFNADTDLSPLTLAVTQPNLIVASKTFGVSTLEELINKLKAEPGKYNFATVGKGSGSHLTSELFLKGTGTEAVAIHYKGSPDAVNSLLAGDTQFASMNPPSVMQLVKDGKLVVLAQAFDTRSPALPDVPTIKETGAGDITSEAWNGYVISSKVDPDIRTKLQKALFDALSNPEIAEKLKSQYMTPIPSSPEDFSKKMESEKLKWKPIIENLNLKK
ncbi:Bug family tripartite tricarboxylate transporter substrate binding protein [Taylorella equigenitalis]|uniref:Bug family tripartite tricarboxylate transporter substrate binding protein n=1 Tax=Taylorella equigenitalis TaxID=29575 RepID=UPI00042A2155|nr:tripartite tricarboxylate transporter substrate binding protein [Taylorella equigenitalis]WDU54187.1 tripartite tricarboxylate transporter substrate binding protein [Taylorella equigenitalis]